MGLAAFAFVLLGGLAGSIVPQKMAQAMNSFPLVAAPLFVLMGNILGAAQLTDRIVRFATSLVGALRGGYAHASILSSMIFAGMVGSAVADAAGTGAVEVRAMKKAGYRPETAAAISAAAATIGPIIPPSLPMVIYGVSGDASIGRLFLAGVIPGVLMGVSLMVMVAIIAPRQGLPRHAFGGLRAIWSAFKDAFFALLAPVILLGGMFSGLFTPTEAAAVADLYALFLGFVVYRTLQVEGPAGDPRQHRRDDRHRDGAGDGGRRARLVHVDLAHSADAGAGDGRRDPPAARVPARVERHPARRRLLHGGARRAADPDPDPRAGGASSFGIDPVQFGLIMIFNLILGTIHPPIGVVLFVMARIADVTFEQISRAILPWLVPLLVVLLAITVWPPLTLWLPGLVMGAK